MSGNCKSCLSPWDIGEKSIAEMHPAFTIEEIYNLTKIDRWFLVQIKEIVDFEEELAGARN